MLGALDIPAKRARAEMEAAEGQLANAQLFAASILELLRGIDLPLRERTGTEEKVGLDDVIRLTLQVLRGEFRTRAQIKVDVKSVPPVWGSSAGLAQVVLNLFVNALQSFPTEGGQQPGWSEGRADNLVTVRLFPRAACVCMEVEDNGIPIPEQSLALMFDPLTNRSSQGGGSRLGLAISKRIVEELGGHIEAERPAEGGTRLRLILPSAV
jgi:signal transduction histidine kinase